MPAYASAIPMRDFGRTGVKISAIGRRGHHFGDPEQKISRQIADRAIDGGITFFDKC